jgi:hypothetical protein
MTAAFIRDGLALLGGSTAFLAASASCNSVLAASQMSVSLAISWTALACVSAAVIAACASVSASWLANSAGS